MIIRNQTSTYDALLDDIDEAKALIMFTMLSAEDSEDPDSIFDSCLIDTEPTRLDQGPVYFFRYAGEIKGFVACQNDVEIEALREVIQIRGAG